MHRSAGVGCTGWRRLIVSQGAGSSRGGPFAQPFGLASLDARALPYIRLFTQPYSDSTNNPGLITQGYPAMNLRLTALSITCALALAACGDTSPPPVQDTMPAAAPVVTEPAAPAAEAPAPVAATGTTDGKPAAVVSDCSTTIEGNDAMQFNVGSITVPSSCSEFTINMQHTGKLPVAAMGHNVVISLTSDLEAIATDGMTAGLAADHVKADDARVVAHSKMVGGGESTSVTFPVSKIQGAGPDSFFCSFPGHWAIMKGTLQVG